MGIYALINDQDRINMRLVKDLDIKEVFEEALKYDKSLMISETIFIDKKYWWSKPIEVKHFSVLHEQFSNDGTRSAYRAREQLSACGSKQTVLAYLYGIINGYLCNTK